MDAKNHVSQNMLALLMVALVAVLSIAAITIISQSAMNQKTVNTFTSFARESAPKPTTVKGNGFPSGTHFTLNIHAKKAGWNPGEMGPGGDNIFIVKDLPCTINLVKSTPQDPKDFYVADKDCSDGVAEYHLPAPTTLEDPNNTLYSVFMRPLGKPGGQLSMNTCALYDDDADPTTPAIELCSLEKVNAVRMKGKSTALNVTDQLLSVVVTYDFDGDGIAETVRIPLFSEDPLYTGVYNYMWQTQGDIKIAQLRFYPGVVTTFTPVQ